MVGFLINGHPVLISQRAEIVVEFDTQGVLGVLDHLSKLCRLDPI